MKNELRIWWIPQVPGIPFRTSISTVEEGVRILDLLTAYDLFQFENNIKPDHCNAGGIEIFEDGEWVSWYDEGMQEDDPRVYVTALNSPKV